MCGTAVLRLRLLSGLSDLENRGEVDAGARGRVVSWLRRVGGVGGVGVAALEASRRGWEWEGEGEGEGRLT